MILSLLKLYIIYYIPTFFIDHQVATNTLERVAPLTHAVGNVLKRVFVIGFSIIIFGKYFFLPSYYCTFKFRKCLFIHIRFPFKKSDILIEYNCLTQVTRYPPKLV